MYKRQAYGLALGEAFQLRDDLLGVYGDPQQTGKPAGDDLREGKRTVLIAHALEHAGAADRDLVQRLLGSAELDGAAVHTLRAILRDTGAVQRVEAEIQALGRQAEAALAGCAARLDPTAAQALAALIPACIERDN